MIRIIKSHNTLNGIKFATMEFALIALIVAPFAGYYCLHQRFVLAFISGGIMLNCLPVVYYGIQALHKGQDASPTIWNSWASDKLNLENPHLLRDTLVLACLTLLPVIVVVLVLMDGIQFRKT